jgi:hypothetical protein
MQDSFEDWQKESAAMNRVYGNAWVNFATSSCNSPMDGFLEAADVTISGPVETLQPMHDRTVRYNAVFNPWEIVAKNSPLNQRAWVMQERLWSNRTIHFATPQFWEYRQSIDSPTLCDDIKGLDPDEISYALRDMPR